MGSIGGTAGNTPQYQDVIELFGYWWEDSGGTPKRVFFTDVACTKRWAELVVKDDGNNNCTRLVDRQANSVISSPSATEQEGG